MRTQIPPALRLRRGPAKGCYDRPAIDSVLDRGSVAHIAFIDGAAPLCIPMLYARVDDEIYVHGSTASRAIRRLSDGVAACLTVTTIRGLVLARSVFEHSANYESVMVFGTFRRVGESDERLNALKALTQVLLPGRWDEVRAPSRQELKATSILALPIDKAAVKVRSGPPDDDDSPDATLDVWAGVVPIIHSYGQPQPTPGLRPGITLSASLERLLSDGLL